MAKTRQEQLIAALNEFYHKPVARVSTELFLSVVAVIFFAIFAIRPTLQTMADLVKEIQDKEKLSKQLDTKIASLGSAQEQYQKYADQLPLLDKAIPRTPLMLEGLKIIEKVASENNLIIQSISVSDLPDETQAATPGAATRKIVSLNITVQGNYLGLRQFVETLMKAQRMFIIDQVDFTLNNDRYDKSLLAKMKVNMPYYAKQ